jgi:hypothetical protein
MDVIGSVELADFRFQVCRALLCPPFGVLGAVVTKQPSNVIS